MPAAAVHGAGGAPPSQRWPRSARPKKYRNLSGVRFFDARIVPPFSAALLSENPFGLSEKPSGRPRPPFLAANRSAAGPARLSGPSAPPFAVLDALGSGYAHRRTPERCLSARGPSSPYTGVPRVPELSLNHDHGRPVDHATPPQCGTVEAQSWRPHPGFGFGPSTLPPTRTSACRFGSILTR